MFKKMMLMAILLINISFFYSELYAANAKAGKTGECTGEYWCEGNDGKCVPLAWDGDKISVWKAGKLHAGNPLRKGVDIIVPDTPLGYEYAYDYFIPDDPANPEIGRGVINGLIYYTINGEETIFTYEFDDSVVYTNLTDWLNASPQINP